MFALAALLTLAPPQEAKVLDAVPAVVVDLTPQVPHERRHLAWAPIGRKIPLRRVVPAPAASGGEGAANGSAEGTSAIAAAPIAFGAAAPPLDGELHLGPPEARPVLLRLERSPTARSYDCLRLDSDRDGDLGDERPLRSEVQELRGGLWSQFECVLAVAIPSPSQPAAAPSSPSPPATDGEAAGSRSCVPYALSLWYVHDPRQPDSEPVLRFTRRGWLEGPARLQDRDAVVMLTDSSLDGVIDRRDSWALAPAARPGELLALDHARPLERHAWLGDEAWRVVSIENGGLRVTLQRIDPGVSRADEERAADLYAADREAKRSGRSLDFATDLDATLAQAAREHRWVLVDFTTTWCGPCRLMQQYVYTADVVVEAARDVLAVQVDGDARRDLAQRFAVRAYPTLLLLGPDGRVVRRAEGYRGVAAMLQFLRR